MIDRLASLARGFGLRTQHETAIAVSAFHKILFAHLEIDFGMSKRSPASIASDAGTIHDDNFRRIDTAHRVNRPAVRPRAPVFSTDPRQWPDPPLSWTAAPCRDHPCRSASPSRGHLPSQHP